MATQVATELFQQVGNYALESKVRVQLQVIEVYQEHVYDLLAPRQTSLQIKLDYKSQVIIPDARNVAAETDQAAIELLNAGL